MQVSSHQQFLLGDIQVSVAHNSLHLEERSVKLQPKAMAVLHYLAINQERVISAQELMGQLWAGRIVTQASVQKSINAIRSALNELHPQQEFIQFFSKRGYQLLVPAQFSDVSIPLGESPSSFAEGFRYWRHLGGAVLGVLTVTSLVLFWFNRPPTMEKHHSTQFSHWQIYTQQAGYQRAASPHPDNQHLAYITEAFVDEKGNTQSQLLIRDASGRDWQIARTNGSWFKLAWSPSGKQLVAVEVNRIPERPLTPDFYEKANFLYSLHFFTLDLANHQLLEKQTLSQWQGRIFSLSWWDEDTVEIVAKQGSSAGNARYRYSKLNQQLSQLDEASGVTNPYASTIFQKVTALARNQGNKTQIDFLDEKQTSFAHYLLPYGYLEVSWIPDGSGLLVFAADKQEVFLLYREGKQVPLTLPALVPANQRIQLSRPVFNPTGDSIYFTQEQRKVDIHQVNFSGEAANITHNNEFNFLASFSHDGKQIIYGKADGQKIQLMLLEQDRVRKATEELLSERLGPIVWNTKGTAVYFNSGHALYQLSLETQTLMLLHQVPESVEAVGLLENGQQLIFAKTQNDIKNLWALDLNTHQEKQLTFGSLGGTLVSGESIFVQYVNAPGLWEMRGINGSPRVINPSFPANTKLLAMSEQTLYFLTGGGCHESSILALSLQNSNISNVLTRSTSFVNTSSFHPVAGVLQTPCYIPDSHIVMLK